MKILTASLLLIISIFSNTLCIAQKKYQAQLLNTSITLDGVMSEEEWEKVEWATEFYKQNSNHSEKAKFNTQFKILYDSEYLYVGIQCYDDSPRDIVTAVTMRDQFAGDWVEINIDSDFDKKDAFSFTVTASGIRGDEYIKTSENWINSWNPKWEAHSKINSLGWIAEMKIPFKELNLKMLPNRLGIQVNRRLARFDENSSWSKVIDNSKWVESFGILEGIKSVSETVYDISYLDNKVPIKLLLEDFDVVVKELTSFYPSLYRYRSKEFIKNHFNKVRSTIYEDMTLYDFHKTILKALNVIGDGHMKVQLPEYYLEHISKKLKRFPFILSFSENGTFIHKSFIEDVVPTGSRLITVDEQSIEKINTKFFNYILSDGYNITGKFQKLTDLFEFYYILDKDNPESITVDFIPPNTEKINTKTISLLSKNEFKKPEKKHNPSFNLSIRDDVAIMTIKTFNHAEGFVKFIDNSFEEISNQGVNKLILDLRGNGGGEESNAMHLYSYLAKKSFKYYDRYEVGINPNARLKTKSTNLSYETLNYLAMISATDTLNRYVISDFEKSNRFINPYPFQKPKEQYRFKGEIITLIDGGSFSATSEICAILKSNNRATLIGEETGGTFDGNTSGIYETLTLPNSKINVRIPLIKYVSAVEINPNNFGKGVVPDVAILTSNLEKNTLLEFSIKYFNNK